MFGTSSKKRCGICGQLKDKSEFHKHKGHFDGLDSRCKLCSNAQARKRYEADPEKYRERDKQWAQAHADYEKKRTRQWYFSNRDKALEYHREYKRANPEKVARDNHNRRTRVLGGSGTITAEEIQELKERYNHTCLCCRRKEPEIKLEVDHVIPLARGGTNTIDNAQPLCVSCNRHKHARHIDYR